MYARVLSVICVLLATATVAQSRRWYATEVGCWITQEKVPASWEDAQQRCERDGAVLASPLNTQLHNYLVSRLNVENNSVAYFIGTRANRPDNGQEVHYVSVEGRRLDDMPMAVFDAIQQLDLEQGDCLSMDRHRIRAVSCWDHLPYFCYSNETMKCGSALATTQAPPTTASTPPPTSTIPPALATTQEPPTTASTPPPTSTIPPALATTQEPPTASTPPPTSTIPQALATTQEPPTTASTPPPTSTIPPALATTQEPPTTASTPPPTSTIPPALATTQAPPTTTSTPPPTTTIPPGPPGYTYYAATRSHYKLHTSKMSWDAANNWCASEGAHLVVLNDAVEADIVTQVVLVGGGNGYGKWTGIRDYRTGGWMDWRTVHGQPVSAVYNLWYVGHPRNDAYTYRCAFFDTFYKRLSDYPCSAATYFVCEVSHH